MKDIIRLYKLYKQPRPKNCAMLASWPGIGDVSLTAAKYLVEKLNATEIGEIEPIHFFEPMGVTVKDNVVESPRFPESKFYYWQSRSDRDKSLVIFIGEEQPSFKGYELVNCVLDVAQRLRVARVYSCAAAVTRIHHSEEIRVWGAATTSDLIDELSKHNVILRGSLRIAGLNGLILGMAKERGMEGICLLGEVPAYATQIANPKASLAVLRVLIKMLGITLDLTELSHLAEQVDEEMDRIAKRVTAEFIDQFTEPIWEQDEDEEEE
ncbi:MAG: PAC2 family protein [Chloroflexi bacterium]|nr:PAC2 family protein [Chloroflexota bacterium]